MRDDINKLRAAKTWDDIQKYLSILMDDVNLWELWIDPDSSVTLETVIQKIENCYQVELFRKKNDD